MPDAAIRKFPLTAPAIATDPRRRPSSKHARQCAQARRSCQQTLRALHGQECAAGALDWDSFVSWGCRINEKLNPVFAASLGGIKSTISGGDNLFGSINVAGESRNANTDADMAERLRVAMRKHCFHHPLVHAFRDHARLAQGCLW